MKIEIWSDVVCPWCYIGKRRLERALDGLEEELGEVEVLWRSFELDPTAPVEQPEPLDESLATKYGMSVEQAAEMMAQMARVGADEGLTLDFARARPGNTLDAHRLLHLAATHGLQSEMKERLLQAYMTEGRRVSERSELVALAGEVGLDRQDVAAVLESDRFVEEVRGDERRAREIGVRGVPFFLIDERGAVSGAQPVDVLRGALRRMAKLGAG